MEDARHCRRSSLPSGGLRRQACTRLRDSFASFHPFPHNEAGAEIALLPAILRPGLAAAKRLAHKRAVRHRKLWCEM